MQSRGVGPRAPSDELGFDAPPSYLAVDVAPEMSFDTVPEVPFDVAPEASVDARIRAKARARARSEEPAPPPRKPNLPPESAEALSVCLACGASPPAGGDCPHDTVAHLTAAGSALVAAARKLAVAVAERHAQERALRRLVALEVSAGRGDIDAPPPALAAPVATPSPCARCGHKPPAATRAARRRAAAEAQRAFAFDGPAEAPEDQSSAPPEAAGSG